MKLLTHVYVFIVVLIACIMSSVLGGQVIDQGEVTAGVIYDVQFGTDTYQYELGYTVGTDSFGFRHRHGYGVSAELTFFLTLEDGTLQTVTHYTRQENSDDWMTITSETGSPIAEAYVTCAGVPPTSLPSLHILEYTHIELLFGGIDDAPVVLFPSDKRNEISAGPSACSLSLSFAAPLVEGGTYDVYYTEDPFLIVSSPFGPKTEGRHLGTATVTQSGDDVSVVVYNALTADNDQPYWFHVAYTTSENDATALYSTEALRDEACPFQGVPPSLEYADAFYYCADVPCTPAEPDDDAAVIWGLSILLAVTVGAVGLLMYKARYSSSAYRSI